MPSKKWNLEDDSDEEDEAKAEGKADEQEEVDPLDAFMQVFNFYCKSFHECKTILSCFAIMFPKINLLSITFLRVTLVC